MTLVSDPSVVSYGQDWGWSVGGETCVTAGYRTGLTMHR